LGAAAASTVLAVASTAPLHYATTSVVANVIDRVGVCHPQCHLDSCQRSQQRIEFSRHCDGRGFVIRIPNIASAASGTLAKIVPFTKYLGVALGAHAAEWPVVHDFSENT
jgi:hypothetical protein